RLYADDSADSRVKVGNRQAPSSQKPPPNRRGFLHFQRRKCIRPAGARKRHPSCSLRVAQDLVTQANVVVTRMIGTLFIIGSTVAVISALLVLKLTYDYPLLRILLASALFFSAST
ncbi:hypothetical protein, partial [Burkholderia ubonensis]|uniref:hypothetical protein n=2 Tax=Burkholderia ubonensis TaxID=101571 RepID=UPI000A76133F